MPIICPAILAENPHQFREQVERIAPFAKRIHIDFTDGEFAASKTISVDQAWWPEGVEADFHMMYKNPSVIYAKHKPDLVILHSESDLGDFAEIAHVLQKADVKVGLALLPQTEVSAILPIIDYLDHVLIFAGKLGYFGGKPNIAAFIHKIKELREAKPELEIGWDGGVDDTNIEQLVEAGVDVLNVGGYIQRAENAQQHFETLQSLIQ